MIESTLLPAGGETGSTLTFVIVAGAPATPVAVKVTGEPGTLTAAAVIVLRPAVVPRIHEPTVAIPWALVVAVAPVIDPPPIASANVTAMPAIGFASASLMVTDGGTGTAVPTVALWLSPAVF